MTPEVVQPRVVTAPGADSDKMSKYRTAGGNGGGNFGTHGETKRGNDIRRGLVADSFSRIAPSQALSSRSSTVRHLPGVLHATGHSPRFGKGGSTPLAFLT